MNSPQAQTSPADTEEADIHDFLKPNVGQFYGKAASSSLPTALWKAIRIVTFATDLIIGSQRINNLRNLGDLRDWNAAEFGVSVDLVFALGEVDAECFLTRDIRVLPLDAWADRRQRLI